MRRQNILRTLFFVIFFGIGTLALSVSVLCEDLLGYYHNRRLLKSGEVCLGRLESLNADYDALLQQLQKDPNFVERIAPATLGIEPGGEGVVYPKATAEQLAAARSALTEQMDRRLTKPEMPGWLTRCSRPARRTILFLAGSFLILISFICFGPVRQSPRRP